MAFMRPPIAGPELPCRAGSDIDSVQQAACLMGFSLDLFVLSHGKSSAEGQA
jgi:hypothetical protein